MIHFKKTAALLLAAALLSVSMAPDAVAASKKKVGRIDLTVECDARVGSSGGEIEITPTGDNTDRYYVDNAEIINDEGDDWIRSMPPMVQVTIGLEDEDEYAFSGTASNYFRLTLGSGSKSRFDKISFESANKKDNGATIILKFRLIFDNEADTRTISTPGNVKWDETQNGVARWDDVSSAKYFQVQLYKNGNLLDDFSRSVYATSYDFSKALTEDGSYQFKIRSVRSSNNAKSSWVTSNTLVIGGGSASSESNSGWQQAADGVRWWWKNTDGSYPASQWKEIDGKWYYFDAEGYMATGWINLNEVYYYLDPATGAMYANCRTPDNCWVNEKGQWVPGM